MLAALLLPWMRCVRLRRHLGSAPACHPAANRPTIGFGEAADAPGVQVGTAAPGWFSIHVAQLLRHAGHAGGSSMQLSCGSCRWLAVLHGRNLERQRLPGCRPACSSCLLHASCNGHHGLLHVALLHCRSLSSRSRTWRGSSCSSSERRVCVLVGVRMSCRRTAATQ